MQKILVEFSAIKSSVFQNFRHSCPGYFPNIRQLSPDIYKIFGNKVLIFFLMLDISSQETIFNKINQVPDSKMGCMPILGWGGGAEILAIFCTECGIDGRFWTNCKRSGIKARFHSSTFL